MSSNLFHLCTYHQTGVIGNRERVDTVSDVAGGQNRPGAPGLIPEAPQLQNYGVPLPILIGVELGPVHTAVLNPCVVCVLKKGLNLFLRLSRQIVRENPKIMQ